MSLCAVCTLHQRIFRNLEDLSQNDMQETHSGKRLTMGRRRGPGFQHEFHFIILWWLHIKTTCCLFSKDHLNIFCTVHTYVVHAYLVLLPPATHSFCLERRELLLVFKGTVQRDFNSVFWHIWIGLGLSKNRFWLKNLSEAPTILDIRNSSSRG